MTDLQRLAEKVLRLRHCLTTARGEDRHSIAAELQETEDAFESKYYALECF